MGEFGSLADIKAAFRVEFSRVITFPMIREKDARPFYADEYAIFGSRIERDRSWWDRWIKGQRSWQHKGSRVAEYDRLVTANPHMYMEGRIAVCRRARITTRARRTTVRVPVS